MSNSYRTVIERLKLFAEGHFLIRKFYHEELPSNDIGKFPEYPMMLVLPVQITPSAGVLDYQFEIIFADLPRDKADENEYHKEIISDCTRLALDLLAEIENNQVLFGQDAEIDGKTATITPFIKEYTHSLDGVQLNFTLRLPYDWSACDIPADYSPNTTDNPTTGGGIVTKIAIYSDGEFVGYANQIDFNTDFNVTFSGGRATIDVVGGGGGGGAVDSVTGNIVNNTDPANPVVTQVQVDWNSSSGLSQILNKPTIPTSLPPSGSAGGDLTGTYPNPTVSKIHGIDVQNGTASDGQILKYHAAENKWKHHTQVKADVGLGNVDNTSDLNKPVSTAQQTALDLKLNKADIWRTVLATDGSSFSGTTSETIVRSVLIPAGTFDGDWNILVRARVRKTGTVGSTGMRIRVNTSNSLTGANLLGWLSAGTSNIYLQMKRDVVVKGANSEVFSNTTSSGSDDLNTNAAATSVAVNWAVDQYLLVTITPTSTSDSYINSFFLIEGRKTLV